MRFYVDFDDCLCETARAFCALAEEMFGIRVPYGEFRFFDMKKTFGLDDGQFERMMARGHRPEELLSYAETPGACRTLGEWMARGHEVSVITGRPLSAYEASREWLDRRGLGEAALYCFDKYGRDNFIRDSAFSLRPEDFYRMEFDYAVEDSPRAFRFFEHLPDLRVMVFDRPWNREHAFPDGRYTRCRSWEDIRRITAEKG